jgi:hypothetical protein
VASKIDMSLQGDKQLRRAFSSLPIKIEKKVTKGAVRAGSLPIRNAIKSVAPVALGYLRDNIKTVVKSYRQGDTVIGITGAKSRWIPVAKDVRWTKTGTVNPALYAHLANQLSPDGKGFMDRGFSFGAGKGEQRFIKFFRRGVEREARKLGFK